jgi:hypothetical protein
MITATACAAGPTGSAGPTGAPSAVTEPGPADPDVQRISPLIAAVPSYQVPFEPMALIQAVNALQRLGRDRAVAVLLAYLRATPPGQPARDGTFLIARALFDPPASAGALPIMKVGMPEPAAPRDPHVLPRFPLALVDDVPLLVIYGYALAGKPQSAEDHLAELARVGVFRARPLAPPDDPLATIDRIAGRAGAALLRDAQIDDDRGRAMILEQGLRLARAATGTDQVAGATGLDARWQAARQALVAHPVVWDAATDQYRPR